MKKTIEIDEKCSACKGTGIYVGYAERDGAGIQCSHCKGTGKFHFIHTYEEFVERKEKKGIKRVYKYNPGIHIGENKKVSLVDFGGISYTDWKNNKPFPEKSEMRKFTCPVWWYQNVNYELKPDWNECTWDKFSDCPHFSNKQKCWEKFDREQEKKEK